MKSETSRVAAGHEQGRMPNNADDRLAQIKHFVRLQSDNQVYVLAFAGGKIHVATVYADDITNPSRLSRELFRKKSLLLAPCSETADGHWPRALWVRFLNERLRVFTSNKEMVAWDAAQPKLDNASL